MRIYHSIEDFSAQNPIVTIGMFDGVHAGHRAILSQMESLRQKNGGETVLLTFWPHPRIFFGKTDGFGLLTTIDEKMELLEQAGLDVCLVLPFSQEFAELSPESYITEILHKGIGAKSVVIGYDHKYGKSGSGTFDLMQEYGKNLGFSVEQITAYSVDSKTVSSTKVRNFISSGEIENANQYLSYNYFLNGTVVSGRHVGRIMGFPTANLHINSEWKEIPANGVYAGYAEFENHRNKAVINIGTNPTVSQENKSSIEAHVIDFQGDLYGKNLRLEFSKFIRNEQRFDSLHDLQCAIANDVREAKR